MADLAYAHARGASSAPRASTASSPPPSSPLRFLFSSDVGLEVCVRVDSVLGELRPGGAHASAMARGEESAGAPEVFVTASLHAGSARSQVGLPATTTYRALEIAADRPVHFDEWLSFPVRYCDLPLDAAIAFTVWRVREGGEGGVAAVPVGGTTLPVFGRNRLLKLGHRRLLLWRGRTGHPGGVAPGDPTPHKAWPDAGVEVLEKVARRHEEAAAPRGGRWHDELAKARVKQLRRRYADGERSCGRAIGLSADADPEAYCDGDSGGGPSAPPKLGAPDGPDGAPALFLSVRLPPFPHPVVYRAAAYKSRAAVPHLQSPDDRSRTFVVHDPEAQKENPVENKYHKLARGARGLAARDLRPKIAERKQIEEIVSSPTKHLTPAERHLMWTFRYSLTDNRLALTKFLRAVDWSDTADVEEALELLNRWTAVEVADALEMLSDFFRNAHVREYATRVLSQASDDEISSYLLQLVQALRYEATNPSPLSEFLVQRCCGTLELATFFNWYLVVEQSEVASAASARFAEVLRDFRASLKAAAPQWSRAIDEQEELNRRLVRLSVEAKQGDGKMKQKEERMRKLLRGSMSDLAEFKTKVTVPLRSHVVVTGVNRDRMRMFKSALVPMMVSFKVDREATEASLAQSAAAAAAAAAGAGRTLAAPATMRAALPQAAVGDEFRVIFKTGDDLRQDQLIIQMINLMDSLLKKVKLDLKLTPYRVLATSPVDGMLEFVPDSHTITSVLADHNKDIREFFQKHNPKPSDMQRCLDTFVKSCAGYCVITFILGIGDRHLENVLLTTSGNLFHIDFGFIFGRDPKPFPPPMKFSKEMVEAMGGADSGHYRDFRKYAGLAFNILRKHASLILNLLSLMSDSNIPDMANDLEKNLLKVQEKFRLDLGDEQAEAFITGLIDESVSALFPRVMEQIHRFAMYWK